MDQAALLSEIAKTERSLAESRDRAKELEGIIAKLDQGSPDIQPLKALITRLLVALEYHEQKRDRLRKQLDSLT